MKNIVVSSLFVLFSFADARAQTPELVLEKGVAPHKAIDAVYAAFSDAYRTLNVEKVGGLYTENAAYLPPDSEILQGREQIRPTFKTFFDWVKKEGQTMTISFRIVQRQVDNNLAYDVGIYTITQYKDGKQAGTGKGKFVVVAAKDKTGSWRFQVDGFSNLQPEKR